MNNSSPSCTSGRIVLVTAAHPSFTTLLHAMSSWDYAPYPSATSEHIKQIQYLWVCREVNTLDKEGNATVEEDIDEMSVMGVVGGVVCPAGYQRFQMYFQAVFVKPAFRRRGVCRELLARVIADTKTFSDCATAEAAHRPPICRIRLHTMITGGASSHVVSCYGRMFDAVHKLYTDFGFQERRRCPGYYDNGADGIEMILELSQRHVRSSRLREAKRERE